MRIVGIDPGKTTGVVVVDVTEGGWTLHSHFELASEGDSRGEQLLGIYEALHAIIGDPYPPQVGTVVMEEMLAYRKASADEKVEACWPDLAAYIREMAGEPGEIHDDDDGSTD